MSCLFQQLQLSSEILFDSQFTRFDAVDAKDKFLVWKSAIEQKMMALFTYLESPCGSERKRRDFLAPSASNVDRQHAPPAFIEDFYYGNGVLLQS